MTCISPPPLDDRTLLAHMDGEGEPDMAAHLARCPHCRDRARSLARLHNRLTTCLYRAVCPSPVALGEYHLDLLPGGEAQAVTQHLGECPHCKREIAQLEDYLAGLAPTLKTGLLEKAKGQVRVLIARLASELEAGQMGQPALAPAYAGLRGAEEARIYQADDVQVAVEVQDDAERPGRKVLLGLVIGAEPGELEAHLWQAGEQIAVVPLDELGNFVIPELAPGGYELILSGPAVEIHIQDLDVGTS